MRELFRGRKLIALIELVALLPATVFLGPLMLAGAVGMSFALAGLLFGSGKSYGVAAVWPILYLLAHIAVGVASLVCLWMLILSGLDVLTPQAKLRWPAVILLLLGLADAVHFLLAPGEVSANLRSSPGGILMWAAMLGLPMLIGVRYIYLLLRQGATPPAQPSAQRRPSAAVPPKF